MRNLFLFVVIALLSSCISREKLIVKSWKFDGMELLSSRDSAEVAFIQKASDQMKADITIRLEADSTYTIMQVKEQRAIRGKWWFSIDKKRLYTLTDLGLTESKVLKLTKSKLVYEAMSPGTNQVVKMTCVSIEPPGSK